MQDETIAVAPATSLDLACRLCGCEEGEPFFVLPKAPVTVASVFDRAEDARAVPQGLVRLTCCPRCGFIYNSAFERDLAEQGARYESSQGTSAHFSDFARRLAAQWVERFGLQGGRALEVGAGDGAFLVQLLRAGVATGLAIDPLAQPAMVPADLAGRIEFDLSKFDTRHAATRASALVCRHTLEHIDDVAGFLKLFSVWASTNPASPILIEVPATDRILTEYAFWDVYYEHCSYFTAASLQHAFALAGLQAEAVRHAYDGQYLLLEARGSAAKASPASAAAADTLTACRRFGAGCQMAIDRCRTRLRALAAEGGPVVLWQGAAKTVALVTALGPDVDLACAVDVNPGRHWLHLPPYGLKVVPPAALVGIQPRHVVLMNPVYLNEVQAQLDALHLAATLHTIDQLMDG